MEKIISLACAILIFTGGISQNTKLPDGLYIIQKVVMEGDSVSNAAGQSFVLFNPDFLEDAPKGSRGLIILTNDHVPLELASEPVLTGQVAGNKKLELAFSRLAAAKLAEFTDKNIMKQATMVLNGKALTMHKIRAAITGGKMEITRCDDNACERIFVELKKKVRK